MRKGEWADRMKRAAAQPTADTSALDQRREELRRELIGLERHAARLGGERQRAAEAAIREVERELDEVKRGLDEHQRQAPRLSEDEVAFVAALAEGFTVIWEKHLPDAGKRRVVELLVEAVEVTVTGTGRPYRREVRVRRQAWLSSG